MERTRPVAARASQVHAATAQGELTLGLGARLASLQFTGTRARQPVLKPETGTGWRWRSRTTLTGCCVTSSFCEAVPVVAAVMASMGCCCLGGSTAGIVFCCLFMLGVVFRVRCAVRWRRWDAEWNESRKKLTVFGVHRQVSRELITRWGRWRPPRLGRGGWRPPSAALGPVRACTRVGWLRMGTEPPMVGCFFSFSFFSSAGKPPPSHGGRHPAYMRDAGGMQPDEEAASRRLLPVFTGECN